MFQLDDGATVAIEVTAAPGEEERISSAREEVVEETGRRFSDALKGVEKATREILDGFATTLQPEQLELTFGLKFSAKAGVVLASTDAEATLSLKATWKPKPASTQAS